MPVPRSHSRTRSLLDQGADQIRQVRRGGEDPDAIHNDLKELEFDGNRAVLLA